MFVSDPHFCAKWSKMTSKNINFVQIYLQNLLFIPISFDKFFNAGKFEGKANSVQW